MAALCASQNVDWRRPYGWAVSGEKTTGILANLDAAYSAEADVDMVYGGTGVPSFSYFS